MANKIQIKRGLKALIPALAVGELGWCTDTNELFIGAAGGNLLVNGGGAISSTVSGTYVGNGQTPSRVIELGFAPKFGMVLSSSTSSTYRGQGENKFIFLLPTHARGVTSSATGTPGSGQITTKGSLGWVSVQNAATHSNYLSFLSRVTANGFEIGAGADDIAYNEGFNMNGYSYDYIMWR